MEYSLSFFLSVALLITPARSESTPFEFVDEYYQKYLQLQPKGSVTPEELFLFGTEIASEFYDTYDALLPELSKKELAILQSKMVGFIVRQDEVEVFQPDYSFFKRANPDSISTDFSGFISVMEKLFHDWEIPIYFELVTDFQGCISLSDSGLSAAINEANSYLKQPTKYHVQVNRAYQELKEDLLQTTCYCADKPTTLKQLEDLEKKVVPAFGKEVRSRILEIQASKSSNIRFECEPS